ncbi:phenylacetate--CoA ligase family protein [Telmatocola sphagniphila]|uniref:phenylacetate--CoA ligase family protein n=1 Tax=Telmatocola sphagniphila TaxID=1123043 RepID=UPI001FE9D773|nr:AMP-binding protein [Telmatocola sphagniphila]
MPFDLKPFRDMLGEILPRNRFYQKKYAGLQIDPDSFQHLSDLTSLPFTLKSDLIADQHNYAPYGQILTYPLEDYCRLHQTSGTSSGRPLRWLDTPASWKGLLNCWTDSFPIMGLSSQDKFFFPFSFGPFLGFWTAFEAASGAGYLCLPGGGMTSTARLRFLLEHEATVICCTPTYALHLAELADREKIDLAASAVRMLIVAGEPGGCIPATRERIEKVWGARVFDHYGMTEVGPVAVEMVELPRSLMLLQNHYLAEVIDPQSDLPVREGDVGELVLTNLRRWGCPLIRYRTGDLVRLKPYQNRICFEGGILGRTDDMIYIRGNNLYPASIEAVVRRFAEVIEFRIVVDHTGPLADLSVEIEPTPFADSTNLAELVARAIRDELLFRVDVKCVATGVLPRFEMKARRVVHIR